MVDSNGSAEDRYEDTVENPIKQKTAFIVLGLALVMIFFVVLQTVFFANDDSSQHVVVTPEPPKLTSQEVENERFRLSYEEEVNLSKTKQVDDTYYEPVTGQPMSRPNVGGGSQSSDGTTVTPMKSKPSGVSLFQMVDSESVQGSIPSDSLQVIETNPLVEDNDEVVNGLTSINDTSTTPPQTSTGSGVSFGEVSFTSAADSEPTISKTVSGNVFSIINGTAKEFIIAGTSGSFKIKVTDSTKFKIDGSYFNFSDLKIADIVTVVGTGKSSSNEISAETVTVTGTYEILMTN